MRAFAVLGLDPKNLIVSFGLLGIFAIIFAESGLFFGFFLPGDSLLFTAGLLTHPNDFFHLDVPVGLLALGCSIAAVGGDQVGYTFGSKMGPRIFNRPDSRFFKREFIDRTEAFFDEHGSKAIVLARFVPIVRTFVPIVAGASNMKYRTFAAYNVIGGVSWATGFVLLGWALGERFPWLTEKVELLAIVIIAVSLVPMGIEILRHRRRAAQERSAVDEIV
jgi:membrane-associated protein